jgi:gas vesicle protein
MANARYRGDGEGNGGGHFVLGLLAGTVLGAGVAMLFAPKPGREFRRDLGEQADKFAADASNRYRKASDGAAQWARKASAAAEEVTERGKELYNNVRDAVAKGADEAQRYRQEADGGDPVQGGSTGSQTS